MNKKRSKPSSLLGRLGQHTFFFGLGNVLPKVIGFLLIPIYTVFLDPEDFGIIDIAISIEAFLTIFMRLGIPGSVTRFYYDYKDTSDLEDYLSTVYWFLLAFGILLGFIVLILGYFYVEDILAGFRFWPYFVLVVCISLFKFTTDIQRRLIQVREQSTYSAKLNTAISFITIFFSILLVIVFKMKALGVLLALSISAFVFFLQAQFYLHKNVKQVFKPHLLKPSLKYAAGVFPHHLMNNAAPLINKTMLLYVGSLAAVGVLGIAQRFASPLVILTGAFQTAYLPIYFSIRKKNEDGSLQQIADLAKQIWVLATIIFLGFSIFGPTAVVFMTPENYHEGAGLLPFYGIIFLLTTLQILYGKEISFSKKTYWFSIFTLSGVITNILIVYFFVEAYGMYALLFGLTASSIVMTSFRLYVVHHMVQVPKDYLFFAVTTIVCTLVLIGFSSFDPRSLTTLNSLGLGVLFFSSYLVLIALLQSFLPKYFKVFDPKLLFKKAS